MCCLDKLGLILENNKLRSKVLIILVLWTQVIKIYQKFPKKFSKISKNILRAMMKTSAQTDVRLKSYGQKAAQKSRLWPMGDFWSFFCPKLCNHQFLRFFSHFLMKFFSDFYSENGPKKWPGLGGQTPIFCKSKIIFTHIYTYHIDFCLQTKTFVSFDNILSTPPPLS